MNPIYDTNHPGYLKPTMPAELGLSFSQVLKGYEMQPGASAKRINKGKAYFNK